MTAHLTLLGAFSLQVGEWSVALGQTGARLIAALGVNGPEATSREQLSRLLWPQKTRDRAGANLRASVWRLPDPAKSLLQIDDQAIALTGVEVDLWSLPSTDDGQKVRDANGYGDDRPGQSISALGRPLLHGWYDDWVLAKRERVAQHQLSLFEARATFYLARNRPSEAIEAGLAAVMIEPLRELPHRLVVQAHLQEGNRDEAVRHVRAVEELFRTELGVGLSQTMLTLIAPPMR